MARIVLSLLALQPSVGGLQSPRRPIASTCARPSVSPAAAAASGPSFSELPLPEWLVDRTEALGYTHATPVQATAIGPLIDRRDAVVLAQTGSGKTLAYMLPLLASLRPSASVQALVLAPSRELAAQVARVARRLAAGSPDRPLVMALLDGSAARRQRVWIRAQPPQTRAALERVLAARCGPEPRQTVFVSASLPQRNHFVKQAGRDLTLHSVTAVAQRWCGTEPMLIHSQPEQPVPEQLRHLVAVCETPRRVAALRVLLRRDDPSLRAAIVFVKAGRPLERIAEAVGGVLQPEPPEILSDESTLRQRARAVASLRDGSRRLLLSTPLGARGLDIPECSHVYLFDLPSSAEDYLHAAGRSGRIGNSGTATVLCAEKELFRLRRIGNALGIDFEDAAPPRT
ncbi:hypothetical protein EMIHUDRAFT_456640 [Emiliania huxleyi CCMP1516]|uniref:DEAD/DEAH box helicase n=2 Tax=Emiliania huxleyi TaxID=2903 RepID=A0A0D3K3G2_EMIH1|nr:hypothetical protein EMIHUDRAFT_456640 [Emiliania huxleyi CCMP1516]EOD30297.1 hypothetical protein EMIHUDRAFT_456640 [Emiliania huxleyi CCMP1516]|eukprot:XP_005782726.1 hypothetical protein EMIHUDRAFT_456640 [Emiliania huxleyi CCMP1516]